MRPLLILSLVLIQSAITACTPPDRIPRATELPRALGGYHLLDPAPEGAATLPNGVLHWSDGEPYGVTIYAAENRIFVITLTAKLESAEEVAEVRAAAERTYGANHVDSGDAWLWTDSATRVSLLINRGTYRISLSDIALMKTTLGDTGEMLPAGQ